MKTFIAQLRRILQRAPGPVKVLAAHVGSALIGVFAAIVLHYVLYRIGLPLEPFIYVSF